MGLPQNINPKTETVHWKLKKKSEVCVTSQRQQLWIDIGHTANVKEEHENIRIVLTKLM